MKIITVIWAVLLFSHFIGGFVDMPEKIGIILPLFYIGLSFFVFNKFPLGYRIFHHVCVAPLGLYYLLGLVLNVRDVYFGDHLESMLAYTWFSSLSIAYIIFCILFLISYTPYLFTVGLAERKIPNQVTHERLL